MNDQGRFARLIVRKPEFVQELPDHKFNKEMPISIGILMSQEQVPEVSACVLYLIVNNLAPQMAAHIDKIGQAVPHKHDCDEIYILVGESGAITFEVTLGEERYEVDTPACVYLPKGLGHGVRPLRAKAGASGGVIPVLFRGTYETLPLE